MNNPTNPPNPTKKVVSEPQSDGIPDFRYCQVCGVTMAAKGYCSRCLTRMLNVYHEVNYPKKKFPGGIPARHLRRLIERAEMKVLAKAAKGKK